MLTVERLDDGEVSPYLVDELRPGDELELRGPIGGYFVWERARRAAAAGRRRLGHRAADAMLRHRAARPRATCRCGCSTRRARSDDVIYRDELERLARDDGVDVRLHADARAARRLEGLRAPHRREMLDEVAWPPSERPLVYVCGPTPFVEAAADALVELGHDAGRIRTERFGPTGG